MGGAKKKPGTEKVLVGTRLLTAILVLESKPDFVHLLEVQFKSLPFTNNILSLFLSPTLSPSTTLHSALFQFAYFSLLCQPSVQQEQQSEKSTLSEECEVECWRRWP